MRSTLPPILLCLACLVACMRGSQQFRMDADGSFRRVTPEAIRDGYQQRLARSLHAVLGDAWIVQVAIPQLPFYSSTEGIGDDAWQWEHIDVTVRVVGREGMQTEPVDRAELEDLVRSRLWDKRTGRLAVDSTVVLAEEAAYASLRQAAAGEPAEGGPATAAGPAADHEPARAEVEPVAAGDDTASPEEGGHGSRAPSVGRRRYLIQDGDTLAIIAAVFYGEAAAWRRIVEANPELDAGQPLPVGREIIIP